MLNFKYMKCINCSSYILCSPQTNLYVFYPNRVFAWMKLKYQ
jgi:hypothetical protein